jgi:hypothetical protein
MKPFCAGLFASLRAGVVAAPTYTARCTKDRDPNYSPPLAALNIQELTKSLASLRARIVADPMQTSQSSKFKGQRF